MAETKNLKFAAPSWSLAAFGLLVGFGLLDNELQKAIKCLAHRIVAFFSLAMEATGRLKTDLFGLINRVKAKYFNQVCLLNGHQD